jgi:YXWGXW repeat-containing protein
MRVAQVLTHTVRAAVVAVLLVAGTSLAEAGTRVYVRVGPPAAVVHVRPVAPGPRHVWVPGYYRYDRRAYVWTPGVWVVPPRRHTVWVEPRWVHDRHGWYFVAGHWR